MSQRGIKLDVLRTFVTVADCGNLAEAAGLLKRSPAAVSMSLKQCEEAFGGALFESDRKAALTPLGCFVREEGRRAVQGFDEAMLSIRRFADGEIGVVRLAVVPSVATRLLPEVTRRFQAQTPQVRLELRDLDSSLVAGAVRNGSVDFGVASLSKAAHDLQQEPLLEEPFGVVCHEQHPLTRHQQPISWQQLESARFISNGLCDALNHPKLTPILNQTRMHVYNVATLLSFIQQDMGVTLLPRLAAWEGMGLSFLPLADQQLLRRLYFLQNPQHQLTPAARAFKQAIQGATQALRADMP